MEVACSFDEFSQVLGDDGYINDNSYFNDATDLPSMLRGFESKTVFDSPESFPESPCSDDDIARVLEISQMSSPSLLESYIPDSFPARPSHHTTDVLDSTSVSLTKTKDPCITNAVLHDVLQTKDPCITNAVLHDVFRNTPTGLYAEDRSPSFLDGLCLPSNVFSNSVSINLNDIIDAKENDLITTSYFDSTPLLSPISEVDHIIPHTPTDYPEQSHQTDDNDIFDIIDANNNRQQQLPTMSDITGVDCQQDESQLSEPKVARSSQKRKRKRKGFTKSAKSKKVKNTNTNPSPPKPPKKSKKAKISEDNLLAKPKHLQSNIDLDLDESNFNAIISKQESIPQEQIAPTQSQTETSNEIPPKEGEATLRRSSRSKKNTENYNFRVTSLVKRVETERRQKEPKQPKGKEKPPPLSKYRRRTANARERDRMKEINDAYDVLKEAVPNVEDESKQKMTKFTILNLALNYIAALREMLGYSDYHASTDSTDGMSLPNFSPDHFDEDRLTNTDIDNSPISDSNKEVVELPLKLECNPQSIYNSLHQTDLTPGDLSSVLNSSTSSL